MPDTGWLKPDANAIWSLDDGSSVHNWHYVGQLSWENNYGAQSLATLDYESPGWPSTGDRSNTQPLIWDWVIPNTLSIPEVAVVTGIEIMLYGFTNQWSHPFTIGVSSLKAGDAVIYEGQPLPGTTLHVIENEDDQPGHPNGPSLNELSWGLPFGGATELGGLPPDTRVSEFFEQFAGSYGFTERHSSVIVSSFGDAPPPPFNYTHTVRLTHAQMKVHYEVSADYINLGPDELEVSISAVSDAELIRRLEAVVAVDVLMEGAALGGEVNLESAPDVEAIFAADLTNGLLFVDSTAYPEIAVTMPDVDIALIRHVDMGSQPLVSLDVVAWTPGTSVNLEAAPEIKTTLIHGIISFVNMSTDPPPEVIVSLDDPGLFVDNVLGSVPTVYVSIVANLQGDIILADECGEAELTVVVSIQDSDLGYVKGMLSNPDISVTLDGNDLVVGAALEFAPLVSVTIPFANLGSKFAEPAPDHRTVFKCPVDRTIRITRKDKTIL